jgi:hypothetical protein
MALMKGVVLMHRSRYVHMLARIYVLMYSCVHGCSEEGPKTLMKGVVPRVMYLAPLAGVTLSIYDSISARIIAKKQVRPASYMICDDECGHMNEPLLFLVSTTALKEA